MAANRFSLNEGSLVRRTVLHVVAFVLGTAMFLAVASLVLLAVGKRLAGPADKSASASGDDSGEDAPVATQTTPGKPGLRPPRKKRGDLPVAKPAEEEEQ